MSQTFNGKAPAARILLIEDDPEYARLIRLLLEQTDLFQADITHVSTLAEGISVLRKTTDFAVILLDISLPDSTGQATLERLLEVSPQQNIIVLTGYEDRTLVQKAIRAGARDFMIKGEFNSEQLARVLGYAIERNRILYRLEEAQRIARIGHWEYNPTDHFFTASDQVYLLFELDPSATRYQYDDIVSPACPLHVLYQSATQAQKNDGYHNLDYSLSLGNDQVRYLSISSRVEQQGRHYYGIIQDISERRQAEALRQANDLAEQSARVREQVIANVSHELRTPMNVILGMINLLSHSALNEVQKEYLITIQEASKILLNLVDDLLLTSTLQQGNFVPAYEPFEIKPCLERIVATLRNKALAKNLGIQLNVSSNCPPVVVGDQQRITQVLYNLLGNAIKYTEQGWVRLDATGLKSKDGRITVTFSVADTGPGIPPDKHREIFEAFTRLHSVNKGYEGFGLGLAISKRIVDQLGGQLSIESYVGEGSRFYFSLPLDIPLPVDTDKAVLALSAGPLKPFSVLIVEDHKMNQIVIRKTLQQRWPDIQVVLAENGQEALDRLADHRVDIILMDIQMPVMDGFEASSRIRAMADPQIARTPILVMTAQINVAESSVYKDCGINDYILKPFEPDILFRKMIDCLSQKH